MESNPNSVMKCTFCASHVNVELKIVRSPANGVDAEDLGLLLCRA